MSGFPPIDTLFLDYPSIRLAGLIAYKLSHLGPVTNHLNIVPGEKVYSMTPVKHFASISDLNNFLKSEHSDKYYYRGQTQRYKMTYNGRIAKLLQLPEFRQFESIQLSFESLMPSLFRSVPKSIYPNWENYQYPKLLNQLWPVINAIISSKNDPLKEFLLKVIKAIIYPHAFKLMLHNFKIDTSKIDDFKNTSHAIIELISLSQHYGFGSTMVDITKDPDIATWFATHKWSGEKINTDEGNGVIYRFIRKNEEINNDLNKELASEDVPTRFAILVAGLYGIADISSFPKELGYRPNAQKGGSILGLENFIVHYVLDLNRCYEVYTFPLKSIKNLSSNISIIDICPPNDPIAKIFDPQNIVLSSNLNFNLLAEFCIGNGIDKDDIKRLFRIKKVGLV